MCTSPQAWLYVTVGSSSVSVMVSVTGANGAL